MPKAGVFPKARIVPSAVTPLSTALGVMAVCGVLLLCLSACSSQSAPSEACVEDERVLDFGFYVFYPPVSYSADTDPSAPGFGAHLG